MSAFEVNATPYGVRVAYKGFPDAREVGEMTTLMEKMMPTLHAGWGILVDMRDNKVFSQEVADLMQGQITLCKRFGLGRAAVVLQSAIVALQARRIAIEGGVIPIIRFIDAGTHPDWEKRAIAWISRGDDPGT